MGQLSALLLDTQRAQRCLNVLAAHQPAAKAKILDNTQARFKARLMTNIMQSHTVVSALAADQLIIPEDLPFIRQTQPGQHPQQARLTGAIRPFNLQDLTCCDLEAKSIEQQPLTA